MSAVAAQSVVIVGGGQAGFQTAASLREGGFAGDVTLVAGEGVLPYQRPPLSKSYLTGGADGFDEVVLRPAAFYAKRDIEVAAGDPATAVDRAAHTVRLASGRTLRYDRLVLALGARPRVLALPGAGLPGVLTLRGFAEAAEVRRRLAASRRVVVVGGGFIGLEVAAAGRALGREVTVVETQSRCMARALSPVSADHLAAEHERQGVRLLLGAQVAGLAADAAGGAVAAVRLGDGRELPADLVVIGAGVLPETSLAAAAGLAVGDGVPVDALLRTADPAISAIGDCASFPGPHGRPIRLESVQNAVDQARHAAADILGRPQPYTAVPWFWTQQYGLKVQIAGVTAGHDRTVVVGEDATGFSVFCFTGDRLAGVESVNRPTDHIRARRLLAADPGLTPADVLRPGFDLGELLRQPA